MNETMFEQMVSEILNQAAQDVESDGGDMVVDVEAFALNNNITVEEAEYVLFHEVLPSVKDSMDEVEPALDNQYFGPEGDISDHLDKQLVAMMDGSVRWLQRINELQERAPQAWSEWKSLQEKYNKLSSGYKPREMQMISPFSGRVEVMVRWESPSMQVDLQELNKRLKVEAAIAFERGEKVLARTIATKRKQVVGQDFLACEEKFWGAWNQPGVKEANEAIKAAWQAWNQLQDKIQERVAELGGWYNAWFGPISCIENGNIWNTTSGDSNSEKVWDNEIERCEELEAALERDREEEERLDSEDAEYLSIALATKAETEAAIQALKSLQAA